WEPPYFTPGRALTGHTATVDAVAFSPDGRTVASGSVDHSVRLWETATGQEVRCFEGHAEDVKGVAFAPNGRVLASAGVDGVVLLWTWRGRAGGVKEPAREQL